MFLLGHLGFGLGFAWLFSWRSTGRIDYRLILLGAILPDLIDKPLAFVLNLDTRLWAHTLLFLFGTLAASLVPRWAALRLVGFGVATHLLLDEIWNEPAIAWYPAFGWEFPTQPFTVDGWLESLLHDPWIQAGEIFGLAILMAFAWVHGIRSWAALRAFIGRGALGGAR